MRAHLQPLLPDVSLLESPHIVYFASNEGEEGAVAFFMPAGTDDARFGMRQLVTECSPSLVREL